MKIFKNFIFHCLLKLGYSIVGKKKLVKHNSFDAIHSYLVSNFLKMGSDITIFDVGANEGDSIKRFRSLFKKSKIHSFEPTNELILKIKKKFDLTDVKLNNFALGEKKAKRKFFLYNAHRVNSFYPMEENSKYKLQRSRGNLENQNSKEVEVNTIDDYCKTNKINKINLLKIDTQGSESEVLRGAKNILDQGLIDIIELEYIFGIAHKGANSLYEIEETLGTRGYKLIAVENAGNIISFSNYQTNLIYVRKLIYDKIKSFHEKNIDVKDVTYSV